MKHEHRYEFIEKIRVFDKERPIISITPPMFNIVGYKYKFMCGSCGKIKCILKNN